jgi:hypothetical protein
MSGFLGELTSDQLDLLRDVSGSAPAYEAEQYICLCPNTLVFHARVEATPTTGSYAQIEIGSVAYGDYTDIRVGQTVLYSSVNNIRKASLLGRVRKAPTSSLLYINETSVSLAAGMQIWVIDDYRLMEKLERVAGGTFYKDWDLTFQQLPPRIWNLPAAVAGLVDGDDVLSHSFGPAVAASVPARTISSYAWEIADGTVTAGDVDEQNVTVEFPVGFRWVHLTVTDSGGVSQVRHIPVWAVPRDFSSVVSTGFTGAQIQSERDAGVTATVEAFDGVDSVLDNTLAVIWSRQFYNGVETNINGNIDFVGRLRTETNDTEADETYGLLKKTSFDLEGVAAQMAATSAPVNLIIKNKTVPAAWNDVRNLTVWRAVHYALFHSTFHELFSLSYDSSDDTYLYPIIGAQGQNALDTTRDLLKSIDADFEWSYDGQVYAARQAVYQTDSERSALPTVADMDDQDWKRFEVQREHREETGWVQANGGSYIAATNYELVVLALAPGAAQGEGVNESPLPGQILTLNLSKKAAQDELRIRAGHHFAASNPTDQATIDHMAGYGWIMPSHSRWYTHTGTYRGIAYTTAIRWLCTSVSIDHNNETGTREVQATYRRETAGAPGQAYEPAAPSQAPAPPPSVPPVPGYPNFPTPPPIYLPPGGGWPPVTPTDTVPLPTDGNTLLLISPDELYLTREALTKSAPRCNPLGIADLLLTGETIRAAAWSRELKGAYCLVSDDTNSRVLHTEDATATAPVWTASDSITGVFTVIRVPSAEGDVYIYSSYGGTWTETFDFTLGDELGWSPYVFSSDDATWAGDGWTAGTNNPSEIAITIGWANGALVTDIKIYMASAPTGPNCHYFWTGGDRASTVTPGIISGLAIGSSIYLGQNVDWAVGVASNTNKLTKVILSGVGSNPFSGGSDSEAKVAYSSDFAATFSAPISVGDVPGLFGGFDVERIGVPTLAGKDGQVAIATTAGGSYADYGDPLPTDFQPSCLVIPRYHLGSTSQANTETNIPHFVVGSAVLGSGNEGMLAVTGSGLIMDDITPTQSGVYGLAISSNCIDMPWLSGLILACIYVYGTTRRLKVSSDTGATWTDRGALGADADYVRFRRTDSTKKQLYWIDSDKLYFSPDRGATIYEKMLPFDGVIGVEPYVY